MGALTDAQVGVTRTCSAGTLCVCNALVVKYLVLIWLRVQG